MGGAPKKEICKSSCIVFFCLKRPSTKQQRNYMFISFVEAPPQPSDPEHQENTKFTTIRWESWEQVEFCKIY